MTFSKITGEIEIKETSEDGNNQREKKERGNLLITLSHEISKSKQQTELFRRENEHDQVKFKSRIFSEFPLFCLKKIGVTFCSSFSNFQFANDVHRRYIFCFFFNISRCNCFGSSVRGDYN